MSAYIAKITVGGTDYKMPFANHEWAIVSGYFAPVQSWVMPAEMAKAIMAQLSKSTGAAREVTLTLGDAIAPVVVKRVYVIGTAPADNPQRLKLLMADVRIYFGFAIFVVDLNVRRRVGETHIIGPTLTGIGGADLSTVADTIAYAPWSLNGTTAYTWNTAKDQALTYLTTPRHGRPAISFTTDSTTLDIEEQVIQETTTDGDGTAGLARAIESMPGAGIYVDLDGVLHVFDAMPGAERTFVEALPKALWRHGDLEFVDLSGIRPSMWRIYVDYALEIRFDYNPPGIGDALSAALAVTYLQNILQVTDQTLSIPQGAWGPARTVGQGTWITLEEAFAAWGGKTVRTFDLPALTDDFVADHWFGDLLQLYCLGGTGTDPIWAMRIQELMRCYRTYFRVNPFFWDKVRHFWNVRAAIIDSVTGTRAPSPVYSNFHYRSLSEYAAADVLTYGEDVLTSLTSSGRLADGHPSGFQVRVIDEELMVIAIDRNIGRYPGHTQIAPSPVINKATYTGGPGLNEACLQKLVHKSDWRLAVVMTCTPASPNDLRRLYEIKVPVSDAIKTLGFSSIPACNAPDQEIRSHLAEADIGWQDDPEVSVAIVTTFGGSATGGAIGPEDPIQALKPINLELELKPLAKAIAVADLVAKLDHYEGELAVPMSGRIVPLGSIHQVIHRVRRNRAVSVIHAKGATGNVDVTEFLRGSARNYLLKQIQKAR